MGPHRNSTRQNKSFLYEVKSLQVQLIGSIHAFNTIVIVPKFLLQLTSVQTSYIFSPSPSSALTPAHTLK